MTLKRVKCHNSKIEEENSSTVGKYQLKIVILSIFVCNFLKIGFNDLSQAQKNITQKLIFKFKVNYFFQ